MKGKLTKEEQKLVSTYENEKRELIRQLLNCDIEREEKADYTKKNVSQNIEMIKKIYEVAQKKFAHLSEENETTFYKAMTMAEMDQLRKENEINDFVLATSDIDLAKEEVAKILNRPVLAQLEVASQLQTILLENKAILMPFLKVKQIEEMEDFTQEKENAKMYKIVLEQQEMESLTENNREELLEHILEETENVNDTIRVCNEMEEEISGFYENIRKLEQLLAKHHFAMEQENYEMDTTEEEKQSDLDDIARINTELTSLKEMATNCFNEKLKKMQLVANWKQDIVTYLKSEFYEINQKQETISSEKKEKVSKTTGDEEVDSVQADCLENIAVVQTLLKNIKELIANQQNHARIAELLGSNYKALNNAFEMKNFAEELDSLVKAISDRVENLTKKNKEDLSKISKVNLQISILMNYLNNAKSAVSKRINRFDEMNILEENELKRGIAETIKNIRCEAELKKLNDDLDILEDKSDFKKFIGKFTGRDKLDKTMLDQIQVRQIAIRKTFKTRMPLAHNYSIHEMIAEIEMFVKENKDDELVLEDVNILRRMKEVLKKNFVIIDSKVVSIVDQKSGKNLPVASRKVNKKELIEIDTYQFLHRYGYDKSYGREEPEYQDTMASEIKRIIDYIKSSDVL